MVKVYPRIGAGCVPNIGDNAMYCSFEMFLPWFCSDTFFSTSSSSLFFFHIVDLVVFLTWSCWTTLSSTCSFVQHASHLLC
jgi:hypothetical protein